MNDFASMNDCIYALIPNCVFSVKNNSGEYIHDGSILHKINDDKVINIIYELLVGSNFRKECLLTVDYLIEKCNYKIDKDNRNSFKNILMSMDNNKYIQIKNTFKKSSDLLIINVENLYEYCENGYTVLTEFELNKLNKISTNRKEFNILIKVYLFIKMMSYKRDDKSEISLICTSKPQRAIISYEYINMFTGVSDIHKVIDKLQKYNLIMYDNVGKIYKYDKKNLKESSNIYVINYICENPKEELILSKKQYKYSLRQDGYTIVKNDYKNNNRSINGYKGSLVKKLNNGTITDKEKEILDTMK